MELLYWKSYQKFMAQKNNKKKKQNKKRQKITKKPQ